MNEMKITEMWKMFILIRLKLIYLTNEVLFFVLVIFI